VSTTRVPTTELVVVGGSLGSMHALEAILHAMPSDFSVPIAVVLHRHRTSASDLPWLIAQVTPLRVTEAEDKQTIRAGTAYLAPADYHLLVERGRFALSVDDAVRYSRPSIDVMFESAADAYAPRLIAVVLTGANSDGARGAVRIHRGGGMVVAQDPSTAEAPAMPQATIDTGAVDRILPLEEIAPFLVERCVPGPRS